MLVPPPFPDATELFSPSLVVFRDAVERNLDRMIAIASGAERLRPHCKTHKTAAVTRLELDRGITAHKAATFAEAEMLARAGVDDILLAYPLIGPSVGRAVRFRQQFPGVTFAATADDPLAAQIMSDAFAAAGTDIGVYLDVETGLQRTGVDPDSPAARQLYRRIAGLPGLKLRGFHVYDGHNGQTDLAERRTAVQAVAARVLRLRDELAADGLPVDEIVCGGTGSFPMWAEVKDPAIRLSPGTCLYQDRGYGEKFPDMDFEPAAWVLARVISRPAPNRLTLDLGHKAVSPDQPAGKRVFFPALPDAVAVLHNEEHLVLETSDAENFPVGSVVWGLPRHICTTTALHASAYVVSAGQVVDEWPTEARDRVLTI